MKNRIKTIRQSANLTQAQFAEKIGLSRNFVAMIEIGQREPSERTLNDICRIFGVDGEWLKTGEGEMFVPLSRSQELAEIFAAVQVGDDAKSRLIKAMARMPDEAFPKFLEFIEGLHEQLKE